MNPIRYLVCLGAACLLTIVSGGKEACGAEVRAGIAQSPLSPGHMSGALAGVGSQPWSITPAIRCGWLVEVVNHAADVRSLHEPDARLDFWSLNALATLGVEKTSGHFRASLALVVGPRFTASRKLVINGADADPDYGRPGASGAGLLTGLELVVNYRRLGAFIGWSADQFGPFGEEEILVGIPLYLLEERRMEFVSAGVTWHL